MSKHASRKKIAIGGDFVTDVLFPTETKTVLIGAKETLFSSTSPDEPMSRGAGGAKYLQDIFSILFRTHFPKPSTVTPTAEAAILHEETIRNLLAQIANQNAPRPSDLQSQEVNYWTVEKRRKHLTPTNEEVYRVIENLGRYSAEADIKSQEQSTYIAPTPRLPEYEQFSSNIPDILVLADHNRQIRHSPTWNTEPYKSWLTHHDSQKCIPLRIILLANRLPKKIVPKAPSKESLWEILFDPINDTALKSTVVVTRFCSQLTT